jgi:hypothetical protein
MIDEGEGGVSDSDEDLVAVTKVVPGSVLSEEVGLTESQKPGHICSKKSSLWRRL